jgi:hypothetical protein
MERRSEEGDTPVLVRALSDQYPEYRGVGEALWESGGTIRQG